jgi:hypothetical protein
MALNETAVIKKETMKELASLDREYTSIALDSSYEIDVLSQFKANLQQVEELNSRLRFVLGEVTGLVRKR